MSETSKLLMLCAASLFVCSAPAALAHTASRKLEGQTVPAPCSK